MITNFFLDNRKGGPHVYSELLNKAGIEHTVLNETGAKIFCEYKMNYPKELLNQKNCQEGISVSYSEGKYPTVYLSNSEFDDPEILIISHGGNSFFVEEILMDGATKAQTIARETLGQVMERIGLA